MKRATDYKKMTKKAEWISIHALVKRATVAHTGTVSDVGISIHALVKRATYLLFY